MSICLVLPTRHRAAIAGRAIRSILSQAPGDFALVVSDNSTTVEEVESLSKHCREIGDARLRYIRPPAALPMPEHWEWALGEAMQATGASHFGLQYDRKIWKDGHLRFVVDVCDRRPGALVTYEADFTYPSREGFGAWRMPASGKLLEISSRRVVELAALGMIYEMGQGFPVLSNCVVPRAILERVRARFGTICTSSTPDTCFAFRFAAVEESYLHLDRAVVIVHAFGRSNAQSLFRGERGGTWDDFASLWGDRSWTGAAPIPDVNLGQNVTFHEYNLVRKEVGDDRMPPIEMAGYLRELARALPLIEVPAARASMEALLRSHGWSPEAPAQPQPPSLVRRLVNRLRRPLQAPPERHFADEADAIEYLLRNPVTLSPHNGLLDVLRPTVVET